MFEELCVLRRFGACFKWYKTALEGWTNALSFYQKGMTERTTCGNRLPSSWKKKTGKNVVN